MSDVINAFFRLLEGRLGLHPVNIAAAALAIVLVLIILSLYLLSKLRSAREMIHQLGKRLGYEPPIGDGTEVFHQEFRKEIVQRARDLKIKQLEERVAEFEAEGSKKDAAMAALEQRAKESGEQLQRSALEIEKTAGRAEEQAQAHRTAVEHFEQRIHDLEAESYANLAESQRRTNELEEQLQQASLRNDKVLALAAEQEHEFRTGVEQFERRIHDLQAESSAKLGAAQEHSRELEEQLQIESIRNQQAAAGAAEQTRNHLTAVDQMEQRMRNLEAESSANLAALGQRARELEGHLRETTHRNVELTAQADKQEQAHRQTVEHLERRMRDMEAETNVNLAELEQHAEELKSRLQQASIRIDEVTARAGEQVHAHRQSVEQFEQRIREMEAGSSASLAASQQRAKELEEQLHQASRRSEEIVAQAAEQTQAHRQTVEQLEDRIRDMESGSSASLVALQHRARELEDRLRQEESRSEIEISQALKEKLERSAGIERLQLRVHDLEAERDARESALAVLESRVKELEEELQQARDRAAKAISAAQTAPALSVGQGEDAAAISGSLLRRSEWITACAVGPILPAGLVAAEAYAAAAVAADSKNSDARQLLAELADLHRAYPGFLPSVAEAVTAFDDKAAAFFGADLAGAADLAESEAHQRYRAGLNWSALLLVNLVLALRQQTGAKSSSGTRALQEMKDALLERLSVNARPSNATAGLASR